MLVLASSFVACKKDLVERFENSHKIQQNKASKTTEIKTSDNFSWQTSKSITLDLQTDETQPILVVGANGEIIGKALLFANSKNEIKLTVSSNSEQLKVLFKGKEFFVSTATNNINLNLSK